MTTIYHMGSEKQTQFPATTLGRFLVLKDRSARACGNIAFGFYLDGECLGWFVPLSACPDRQERIDRFKAAEKAIQDRQEAYEARWTAWRDAGRQDEEPTLEEDFSEYEAARDGVYPLRTSLGAALKRRGDYLTWNEIERLSLLENGR